jgi:hypothetical protein
VSCYILAVRAVPTGSGDCRARPKKFFDREGRQGREGNPKEYKKRSASQSEHGPLKMGKWYFEYF